MCTLVNSDDPDEMLDGVAFHQGLHCLLRQKNSSEKEVQFCLEIITCDASIYTMDHPKLITCTCISNEKEESISAERVKLFRGQRFHLSARNYE